MCFPDGFAVMFLPPIMSVEAKRTDHLPIVKENAAPRGAGGRRCRERQLPLLAQLKQG